MRTQSNLLALSIACILFIIFFSASRPTWAQAGLSEAYVLTEDDLAFMPQFCRAKVTKKLPKNVYEGWSNKFGPENWLHMHHYCFGLKALQLSYSNFRDLTSRTYQARVAETEFNYVLRHSEEDFYMRPEILVHRGRAQTLARAYEPAKKSFEEALKINPKSVDAWVALGDLYSLIGRKNDAIKTLEKAIEVTGEEQNKKILLRLNDLRSTNSQSKKPSLPAE
ncbi:MAG: tetratricopeptide repeat protein [Methyloversatilis sp.]|nr:tetratricopeptide repeat protein [Methyloversatilis sp.]